MPKHKHKKLIAVVFLPLLSALLLILSFPAFNKGYLAWFSLLPLFFYCRETGPGRRAFTGGMLAGFIFFLYLYSYMAHAVNFLFPPYLGLLVVVLSSFVSSLYFAGFALAFAFFLKWGRPLLTALAASSLWVLLEYLRSAGLLGHSGGFLGYSQADYFMLLPLVSLYGYWGLPFLMVLFQVALFSVLPLLWRKTGSPLTGRKTALPFLLFASMLVAGLWLPSLFPVQEKEENLRIALLQGNISQEDVLNPTMASANFQKYIALTKEAGERYGALDLIVWPETVLSQNVARTRAKAPGELAALAVQTGAPILFGAMFEDLATGDVFNSILLQRPGFPSFDEQRYDKQRLVPFAEYFPLHNLLNKILKSDVSLGTYTPGRAAAPFSLGNFNPGGIVCFESYFPRPALEKARQGAEHLFVLTNDAWFLQSHGLEQHIRVAPFRAAELGIGVTQVANTGLTRSYDYRGKEVYALPSHREETGLLETVMPQRRTLYRLWGDYFVLLCAAALAFCLFKSRGGRSAVGNS
ncbi:MAG: apolipoprotein N-acyltransferase [Bacillota bacterium]